MLSSTTADIIYTLLVEEGGAPEHEREAFIREYTDKEPSKEWRFRGRLGFGGKFRIGERGGKPRLYVDCYPEDNNDERQRIMDGINSRLACHY